MDLHPELNEQIFLLISFFCAATPSYKATDLLLEKFNIQNKEEIKDFWYRGKGWPGFATVIKKSGIENRISYQESWGNILSNHAHFRCKICPDGIGMLADIAFADDWEIENGKPVFHEKDGRNIIIIRTASGKKAIDGAVGKEYLTTTVFNINNLNFIQPSHRNRRIIIGARLLALRFCFLW
jgi:coenzyme F420 hydrogenase subunit beta